MSDSRRGLTSKDDCLQAGSVAESEDACGTSDEDPDGLEEHWKTLCHLQTRLSYQHEDDDVLQGRCQSGQLGVVHHSEYRRGGGAGLLETDQGHQRTDQEFLLHKDSWIFAFRPCFFVFF